jgi:hypothetical protein
VAPSAGRRAYINVITVTVGLQNLVEGNKDLLSDESEDDLDDSMYENYAKFY